MNEHWSADTNLTTTTTFASSTTSSIPLREQVLIDAFNSYIQIGIGGLLFLFGLTFNSLSLLYFRVSRSFRHTTFQLYFSIISILDTIRLLEFLVFILFDKGYLKVTLILCRAIFFTIMFTGQVKTTSTLHFFRPAEHRGPFWRVGEDEKSRRRLFESIQAIKERRHVSHSNLRGFPLTSQLSSLSLSLSVSR